MAHIHNSQHNQKKIVRVQTNTVVIYGHPELSGEEKSKFEFVTVPLHLHNKT